LSRATSQMQGDHCVFGMARKQLLQRVHGEAVSKQVLFAGCSYEV
jgi:hypothetical protein